MQGLEITPASFEEAMELQDAVGNALSAKKIDLDFDITGAEEKLNSGDIGTVLQLAISVATDKRVRNSLFTCAKRARYKNQSIDADFFEHKENREKYYPIMIEILKVNLLPFFGGLGGLLQTAKGMIKTSSPE